ncbi:hypothetical protein DERP_010320 [Dermatophagoides pteronyssinus]|uniref:Uncharacterized protein n=1 Tax=Dermatophagoides pteronyssinus TaxID=6956 RepID=A0ABQ8IYS5_DERPT|nr:hypothetical protein DERP_010320 [Dermatophagoides pteronyssinus]
MCFVYVIIYGPQGRRLSLSVFRGFCNGANRKQNQNPKQSSKSKWNQEKKKTKIGCTGIKPEPIIKDYKDSHFSICFH